MILHIAVRFLDGRFHGRGDAEQPEWPPSPFRLFQALLAGAAANWSEARASAFRWLESLAPPTIVAPDVRRGSRQLTYVPNNNEDHQRTAKFIQPHILPDGQSVVHYLWNFAVGEEATRHAQAMAQIARHIRCLGWGLDMAIGHAEICDQPPPIGQNLRVHAPAPADFGGTPARLPCPGSLQSLLAAHDSFLNRIRTNTKTGRTEIHDQPGAIHFTTVAYGPCPTRPYCAFELTSPDEDDEPTSFHPRQIKALVGMVRGLLGSARVRKTLGDAAVDQVLLGHPDKTDGPRLSILPLLSVGHRHADARVRRLILAEPFGAAGDICPVLAELLNGKELVPVGAGAAPVARLLRLPQNDRYTRWWYAGSERTWASVSPVLLPGFDGRTDRRRSGQRQLPASKKLDRAHKLVLKALAQAGIALPCQVEIGPLSWWPGVPHASSFVPRDKLGPAPRYHVKLTFEQPFSGPLSLGRQRHTGLGVFAALRQDD